MGINFRVASMFGALSDVVGIKSGLALDRQYLCQILSRNDRFQPLLKLDDESTIRIESVTFEEMIELLLFCVGRLERTNNRTPLTTVYHKYKGRPKELQIFHAIARSFADFVKREAANPNLQPGHRIDPSPFLRKSLEDCGYIGFKIANDLISCLMVQLEIQSCHFPNVSEWSDVVELSELFQSEGLKTQYGQFFDQRYIDYLNRNFDNIDRIQWRKFEGLTAEYFSRRGFFVRIGPGRNDDGIDVRVWPSDQVAERPPVIVVQCKRQKQAVSKVTVKSLYADVINEGATSGVVVTTSKLSPGAKEVCIARQYPIGEADRSTIRKWIAEMRKPGMGVAT